MTGRKLLFTASLLLLGLPPVCALAADVKTQSSTQYLWYNNPFQDKSQGEILRYVKLSATAALRTAFNNRFVSGDPGAHVHNDWSAAQRPCDSLDELDDGALNGFVPFSGKAAFSR